MLEGNNFYKGLSGGRNSGDFYPGIQGISGSS
jgi:hypothetical protein